MVHGINAHGTRRLRPRVPRRRRDHRPRDRRRARARLCDRPPRRVGQAVATASPRSRSACRTPQAAIGVVRAELSPHAARVLAFGNALHDARDVPPARRLRRGAARPRHVLPRALELARELAAMPAEVYRARSSTCAARRSTRCARRPRTIRCWRAGCRDGRLRAGRVPPHDADRAPAGGPRPHAQGEGAARRPAHRHPPQVAPAHALDRRARARSTVTRVMRRPRTRGSRSDAASAHAAPVRTGGQAMRRSSGPSDCTSSVGAQRQPCAPRRRPSPPRGSRRVTTRRSALAPPATGPQSCARRAYGIGPREPPCKRRRATAVDGQRPARRPRRSRPSARRSTRCLEPRSRTRSPDSQ